MRAASLVLPAVAILALAACDGAPSFPEPPRTVVYRTDTTADAYFGTAATRGIADYDLGFMASSLHGMGEPPFPRAVLDSGVTVMRFLWRHTYLAGVAVRITRSADGCRMTTTVREPDLWLLGTLESPSSTVQPGALLRRDTTPIDPATCDNLAARMTTVRLQSRPPFEHLLGCQGATWIFERLDNRGHTMHMQWYPDSTGSPAVWNTGMAFLDAAHERARTARRPY